MSPDTIPRDVVYTALRVNLPLFGIACVALVAGISSLIFARLKSRDRLLLWVGVFSVLYAIRLFVENELVRDIFNAPGREYFRWDLCLTYVIAVPYALFARELLGRGWKGTISVWLWAEIGFALCAIPAIFFAHIAYWTGLINGVLVVCGTLLILVHILARRNRANAFAAPLAWTIVVFSIFVLLENRGVLLLESRDVRHEGIDIEPLGFLVLLTGLGTTAARRALNTERKLAEVEQELTTARRIQESIIPQAPPDLPSLRLATRYQPMTAVAGDYYDFLKTSSHCVTILVADVSGHGVPAALVACMLKVGFAAQKPRASDPAAILTGLNTMLSGGLAGQYVTAACAAVDMQQRVIVYAGAGHPPGMLLRRETGEIVELAENGLFIGPFPQATYQSMSVNFENGDKLLLYTDGIVEANGPDKKEFGRERLAQFFKDSADQDPAEFIDRLFHMIGSDPQSDDLTVVVAHFG